MDAVSGARSSNAHVAPAPRSLIASTGSFALALVAILLIVFVLISARTFLRSWNYRETLKDESFGGASFDRAAREMATGDLLFFTAAAHPFHNSWLNKTLFTHVGVVIRGRDLEDTQIAPDDHRLHELSPAGTYVSECAEGIQLADLSGAQRSLPGGSYLIPLGPRVHAYNGLVYWSPRAAGSRLSGGERAAIAQRALDRAARPYPGRWAMIFGALVGWNVSPHHQCYQHAGHVLNAADGEPRPKNADQRRASNLAAAHKAYGAAAAEEPRATADGASTLLPWTTDFFRSSAAMDAAAHGTDPRYERAIVVHRLDDLEREGASQVNNRIHGFDPANDRRVRFSE